MKNILWYLKQLFPMTYRTTYASDGISHFTVWKMWMGRTYDVDDYVILREGEELSEQLVDAVCKRTINEFKRVNNELMNELREIGVTE